MPASHGKTRSTIASEASIPPRPAKLGRRRRGRVLPTLPQAEAVLLAARRRVSLSCRGFRACSNAVALSLTGPSLSIILGVGTPARLMLRPKDNGE